MSYKRNSIFMALINFDFQPYHAQQFKNIFLKYLHLCFSHYWVEPDRNRRSERKQAFSKRPSIFLVLATNTFTIYTLHKFFLKW